MEYTEIWNEAYDLFTDGTKSESRCYNDMQRFLEEQVKVGNLSAADKPVMARDIMETAGL